MRTLWLLRHAKSSWDDPSTADHDRPLAARGRRAASAIAVWFERAGPRPDLVLCSTATRARETLAPVLASLGSAEVRYEEALYTFDAGVIVQRIRDAPDHVRELLIVGHNPAMQDTVLSLAGDGERLPVVTGKFPTGAVARIDLDVDRWSDVAPRSGTLVVFMTPRDLDDQTR